MSEKKIIMTFIVGLGFLVLLYAVRSSYYIVHPGETALRLRFGSIIDAQKESGIYARIPFVDEIVIMNNRICKMEVDLQGGLSKDLQSVTTKFIINYKIDDAISLYKSIGTDFEQIIIKPFAIESIKSGLSKYTAEHLIQYRDETKDIIYKDLKERLKKFDITIIDVSFAYAQFSQEFMLSVERKQVAEQDARTAKNMTEKIKEEALQIKTMADAESYSMRIKKEALTPELIELKKIEKWNGVLPHVAGNIPTIKI
jgi:prohibitin 2